LIFLDQNAHFEKTKQEHDEVQLMPGAVVESFVGSKGLQQVNFYFRNALLKSRGLAEFCDMGIGF
jgi:hypothetical protein